MTRTENLITNIFVRNLKYTGLRTWKPNIKIY